MTAIFQAAVKPPGRLRAGIYFEESAGFADQSVFNWPANRSPVKAVCRQLTALRKLVAAFVHDCRLRLNAANND